MKRIVMLIIACFILLCFNVHAAAKVDFGLYGQFGRMWGMMETSDNPDNSKKLRVNTLTGGVSIDVVNVMSWSKPYYGMGFGLNVGFGMYQQSFKNLEMSNDQTNGFTSSGLAVIGGNTNLIQVNNVMVLELNPMYRFYPTKELAIGIGATVMISLGKSMAAKFADNDFFTNEATGIGQYYLAPLAFGLLIDASITKYFGNFGMYFGINIRSALPPILSVGVEGKAGVKWRFNT